VAIICTMQDKLVRSKNDSQLPAKLAQTLHRPLEDPK